MTRDVNGPDEPENGYDELDVPPSRFSVMTGTLAAIGIATLLIFSGVVWYAYNAGVNDAEQGALPVVKAEAGDIKVKPDDPGGTNFAHQDKTVYDKIDGNEAGLEQLLPGSEEPREKPHIISPYNNELPAAGQPKVVRIPPPVSGATPPAPGAAPEVTAPVIPDPMGRTGADTEKSEVVAAEPAPEVSTTSAKPESAIPDQTQEPEQASPAEAPQDQAALQTEAAKAGTAPAVPGGKTYVLQLGAFRSSLAADAGWKLLAARHAGVLGSLEHYVSQADLGEKGQFFRLQAGPFTERAAAATQCAALKSAGVDCLVAAR
ncbi:MAG: SPOR domain-containing protein [Alphaproteobacteria bacterium]